MWKVTAPLNLARVRRHAGSAYRGWARLLLATAAGPTLVLHLKSLGLQLACVEPASVPRRIEAQRRHWGAAGTIGRLLLKLCRKR